MSFRTKFARHMRQPFPAAAANETPTIETPANESGPDTDTTGV